jgi:hypothetical protein
MRHARSKTIALVASASCPGHESSSDRILDRTTWIEYKAAAAGCYGELIARGVAHGDIDLAEHGLSTADSQVLQKVFDRLLCMLRKGLGKRGAG